VTDGNRFEPTPARPLFDMQIPYGVTGWDFDVSQDGQRFLVNTVEEQNAPPPITLVVNWTAAIKK
jgi:hypothetical protein